MKKSRIIQLMLFFILLLIFDCRKKEELPEKPTNLTAKIISETEIDLSWTDNSTNEAGFKLERSKNGGTDWTPVTSTGKDVSSYKNTGLDAGTSYSFKVMAFNAIGASEYSNIASGSTPAAIVYSLGTVTTSAVTDITRNTASCGGNVTADGNSPILARGICWGTAENPTVQNSKTTDGGGTGAFTSSLTELLPGIQYYVRAYATNSVGTAYGEQVPFTTLAPLPVVATLTTTEATSVTSFSAMSGGNITADGGVTVTARGICWSTTENPTIENDTLNSGTGTGSFTGQLEGLSGSTTYYVRAYAINSAGTAYGAQVSFITSAPSAWVPDLTTITVSNKTATSAQTGGNITSDKGLPVTVRGVCWSTSPSPSVSNDTTINGSGPGSFVSTIKNLTPNTKYYIRAYATNSQGTGYGDEITITTDNVVPPVATSADATSFSATSATLNGSVNANGTETAISFEYGTTFMYGLTAAATPATATGITPASALAIITGLSPNTLYHFRIKAVSPGGTVYGDDLTFTTLILPAATTGSAINIYPTTVTLSGNVNASGNTTSIKFQYGTTTEYGTTLLGIPDNANGVSEVYSVVDLSGLTKSTTYHFRIVAENRAGTTNGEDKTFTTLENDPVLPSVSTKAVTNITSSTATGGGNITNDGGATVIARGICYGTNPAPTLDDFRTANDEGNGEYSSPFTGLTASTTYYVRAYATNMIGTSYGNEVSFTTSAPPADLPTVTTKPVTGKTHESAVSGGEITSDGGGSITARGVCWSENENPTTTDGKTTDAPGTGEFTSNITGLSASKLYYVRAYATNSAGTAYGDPELFVTSDPPAGLATISTTAGSDVTISSFLSGGNITNDGGGTITERGVCYSLTPGPTIAGSKTSDGNDAGAFASSISGLSVSTKYYFRAYATNSAGTAYGEELNITTLAPPPVLATVTTTSTVTSITYNSGTAGGNVTNEGNTTVTERGVCWSTSANPTTSNSKLANGSGSGTFTVSVTGLNASTTYHVRAYAINSVGTAYGDDVSFITSAPPLASVTTADYSAVTYNSATTGGEVTSSGGLTVTARGVCYSTTTNPTLSNSFTINGSGIGTFTSNLTDLSANTTYYFRAYATNAAGTAYGDQKSFKTLLLPGAPELTTTDASPIGTTTATSGGNITDAGGSATITEKGVCWSTSANPTKDLATKTSNGSGTGAFTSSITGLFPCTTYHIRAYATNSDGITAYGADKTFTTGSVLPAVSTTTLTSATSTSVNTGGTISGDCSGTVTERGVCYGTSTSPTTSGSKIINASGGSGSYTSNIVGLTPCTTYYIRAYAINGSGVQYGNELSFTTSTVNVTISTNTSVVSVTSTTASSGGTISGNCMSTITARGVCWNTSPNPTVSLSTKTVDGSGGGSFTSNLTVLTPCTLYYIRAYATNSSGVTVYGAEVVSFTTSTVATTVSTNTATSITATSAVLGGSITGYCGSTITARGVCYSINPNPTTASSKTNHGSGSTPFSTTVTGLTRATTYYYRAYATNPSGTVYGTEYSFTTLAVLPTVSTSSIGSIFSNSQASGGGNVTDEGGASVTAKGICWSTSYNPTTSNFTYGGGSGPGSFTGTMTGLSAGTTYYVRAYATNSVGTAYGVNLSFTTPATLTDYNGNVYNTVSINGNVWMQSNLKVSNWSAAPIPGGSDTAVMVQLPMKWTYNDNATYADTYGYMYNWSAVTSQYHICPTGWHVPSATEWGTLASALGGYTVAGSTMNDTYSTRYFLPGTGWIYNYYYWNDAMTGHNNSSLFYGRGGGYYSGGYSGLLNNTRWWTSTSNYRYVQIQYNSSYLYGIGSASSGTASDAYYIRCKKD